MRQAAIPSLQSSEQDSCGLHSLRTPPTDLRVLILQFKQKMSMTQGHRHFLAEREGFEPSLELTPYYRFSKPAPSTTWVPLRVG